MSKLSIRITDVLVFTVLLLPSAAFAHGKGIAMFVIGSPLSVVPFLIAGVMIKKLFVRKFVWIYWLIVVVCSLIWSLFMLISANILDSHFLDNFLPDQYQEIVIAASIASLPIVLVLVLKPYFRHFAKNL